MKEPKPSPVFYSPRGRLLADLRREYLLRGLPLAGFDAWLDELLTAGGLPPQAIRELKRERLS